VNRKAAMPIDPIPPTAGGLPSWSMRLPRLAALMLVLLGAGRLPAAVADLVRFGDDASERQHRLAASGSSSATMAEVELGNVRERYRGRVVSGRGSALAVTLALPAGGAKPVRYLLEVEEIHRRQWQAFGYALQVNGREVYFRTYEEQAAGPNHYFVGIPGDAIPDPGAVTVRFVNRGAAGFVLSRAWLYRDFTALAEEERIARPLAVLGPGPYPAAKSPDLVLGYFKDEHANYIYNGSTAAVDEYLGRVGGLNVPTQLVLSAWFCSCPGGPDGRGGYFSDPRYSQAIARDGRLFAQYPNVWGNSFGYPSMSEPAINRFLDRSREDTCRAIQRRLDLMKAAGRPFRDLQLMSDIGPFYWDDADYSAFEIEAAQRDGVRLEPGSSAPEVQAWRFRHLSQVFERIAAAFRAGIQRESVLVERGRVALPEDQLDENLYTHPWVRVGYPAGDLRWRGWQTGVVDGMWTTGEMGAGRQAVYDYLLARGKVGIGNMYLGGVSTERLIAMLSLHYQRGWRFAACYAPDPEAWKALAVIEGFADLPAMPPVQYERRALDVFFEISGNLGERQGLVAADNVRCGQLAGVRGALPGDNGKPGRLVYRLDVDDAEAQTRAVLFFQGHVPDKDLSLAVAGADGRWQPIGRPANPQTDHCLNTIGGKGAAVTSVALPRLPDGSLPRQLRIEFASGSIQRVRVGLTWERLAGHAATSAALSPADEEVRRLADETWPLRSQHATDRTWTCRESRLQSLWVQQRRMTERLIERFRALGGDAAILAEAEALAQDGRVASAYRRLVGEISQCLPARYAVRGHGPLGRHPIEVRLPHDDAAAVVTVLRCQDGRVELALDAETSMTATVTIRDLADGAYALERPAPGRFALSRQAQAGEGTLQAQQGTLRVELPVAPPGTAIPRRFTGTLARRDGTAGILEVWSAPSTTAIQVVRLPKQGAQLRRREVHAAAWKERTPPSPGDWCEVETDDQGVVTRLDAVYGETTGTITAFERPGFTADAHAGIVTLDGDRRFELSWGVNAGTRFDTALLQGNPHLYNFDRLEQGLRPGQRVTLAYTPAGLPGCPDRIQAIRQPNRIALEDKVQGTEEDWRSLPLSVQGIRYQADWRKGRKAGWGGGGALFNANRTHEQPGEVVYRISSDSPLGDTGVFLSGRTIIDERNRFVVFASTDGKNWTRCGEVSASEAYEPSQMNVDISAVARGQRTCLVKVQIAGTGDWCILWNILVRTEQPEAAARP
jgi:hypothetical protein